MKSKLKGYVEEVIKLNKANIEAGQTWTELDNKISDSSLSIINLTYLDFIEKNTSAIEDLDFQLSSLSDNNLADKVNLINEKLKLQELAVRNDAVQFDVLFEAFKSGKISADQFTQSTDELTKSFQQNALAVKSLAIEALKTQLDLGNQKKSAMDEIINLTKQMIQQEIKDLNDADNTRIKSLKDQNDLLKEQLKREKEIADEKKKAIDDELKRYKEIIDAQKRSLDLEKEKRTYQQELDKKQLDVTKIQDRLSELANNDSLSAKAEKTKLLEELAQKQLDLDNYVFNNSIDKQKEALDSEWDRFNKQKEAEKDLIDKNLKIYEDYINGKMKLNDDEAEQMRGIMDERANSIINNGELTRMAMARIDSEGSALYEKLIGFNRIYGTGIDEDIIKSWDEYLRLVEFGGNTVFDSYTTNLREILRLTKEISNYQSDMYSRGNIGVRNYLEGFGYDVDWNTGSCFCQQKSVANIRIFL